MKNIAVRTFLLFGVSLFIIYFSFFTALQAQNLVPNFSFEQYDTCPNMQDQIQFATGWSKYSSLITTPDYYNACDTLFYSVPYNGQGYQPAHRNCNAYIGLVNFWSPFTYREHIGIQLNQPLIIGQKYFISFYAVMSDSYLGNHYYNMPSNKLGVRLSTISYNGNNAAPIDNFAHLYTTEIINDSINWHQISGSIIADSAYDYLILGNFFDDAHTDTMHFNCNSCLNYMSSYYLDDICLSTDSLLCNGGIDLLPCSIGMNEFVFDKVINVFPNPVEDLLQIQLIQNKTVAEIKIYNLFGQIIIKTTLTGIESSIDISGLQNGVYIIEVATTSNISRQKFIKQ